MWRKLFRPKWRHRNPAIRAEAVQLLSTGDPGFIEVIRHDPDTGIRRQALRRVTDMQLLLDLQHNDSDSSVSRAAGRRLWHLLAQCDDAASVQQTLAVQKEHGNSEMAEYLIRHCRSPRVRLQALEKIEGPALLSEISLSDADTSIRLQALERITRLSTLKRIAKESRGKNKRVARRARELAEQQALLNELPQLQQQLCEKIEHLASFQQPDQTTMHQLRQQWEKIGGDASRELKSRFSNAQLQISEAIEASRNNKAQQDHQREICEQSDALLLDLEQNANAPALNLNEVEAAEWMLRNSWKQLEQELDSVNPALKNRFSKSQQKLEQRRRQIGQHRQQHAKQLAVIADMQNLAGSDRQLTASRIKALESRWHAQPSKSDSAMEERFRQYHSRAKQRLQVNIDSAKKLEAELDLHLQQLDTALEQGELNAAGAARSKSQQCLERMEKLATAQLRQRKAYYHRLLGRFSELRDWQRFGSDHVREDLISEMQQLTQSGLPARELASSVRAIRDQWRQLDRKGGPAPEATWNRFNALAEQAYAPVIADQLQHQQEQQQAAQKRIEFCTLLEKEYAQIDWSTPDWPAIDARIQDARNQWRKLGGVDSTTWKKLNQCFIDAVKPFDARLGEVRKSETVRREHLIKQVQRLSQEADIDIAIRQAKTAQAEWKPIIRAAKQVEQKLWKQFKIATDAVFARRTALHDSEHQEQQANASAKAAVCEKLQQLLTTGTGDWAAARLARDQLMEEWNSIGPAPGHQYKSLQQKFKQLKRAFDEAESASLKKRDRRHLELLVHKSGLCDEMEQQLCNGESDISSLSEQWSAMPALEASTEKRMQARYRRIIEASTNGARAIEDLCAGSSSNLQKSQKLCLEMELLLEIESPVEFHGQRREWQLTHLSSAMSGGLSHDGGSNDAARRLLQESCVNGPLPADSVASIRQREQNILAALLK